MKPVLKLDGEVYEVVSINFQGGEVTYLQIQKENETPMLWNENLPIRDVPHFSPGAIEWRERYEPLHQAIDELVAEYDEQLTHLAKQIAESYANTSTVEIAVANQYRLLKEHIHNTLKMKEFVSEVYNQF